jgi:branched-chain amino acid transport system permease protein
MPAKLAGSLKAIVFQLASLTDVHWTMSGEVILVAGVLTFRRGIVGELANWLRVKL